MGFCFNPHSVLLALFLVFCDGGLGSHRDTCKDQHIKRCARSVTVTGLAAGVSLHLAAVLHGAVVGHLHRLADVGFPALQHLLLVQLLVHPERHQLRARQPLPGNTQTNTQELNHFRSNKNKVNRLFKCYKNSTVGITGRVT